MVDVFGSGGSYSNPTSKFDIQLKKKIEYDGKSLAESEDFSLRQI